MANEFDFTPFAVGGAQRPDSFSGLSPEFRNLLSTMIQSAPENIRGGIQFTSGYRSNDRQAQLYQAALQKYGSPEAARKWVAPPGKSQHNHGSAVDFKWGSKDARDWVHQNAPQFGLNFPMSNEDWHVEPIGARGHKHQNQMQGDPISVAAGAPAPALPPAQNVGTPVVTPVQEQPAAGIPTSPAPQEEMSPLGSLLANMQPMATGFGDNMSAQQTQGPTATPGESGLAAQNAMMGAEQSKGLLASLSPDIGAMLSLGGKKKAPAGII